MDLTFFSPLFLVKHVSSSQFFFSTQCSSVFSLGKKAGEAARLKRLSHKILNPFLTLYCSLCKCEQLAQLLKPYISVSHQSMEMISLPLQDCCKS